MNTNETLAGGREIEVQTIEGKAQKITLKKCSHLRVGELLSAVSLGDLAQAMLYSGMSEGELEGLSVESYYKILDEGENLHEPIITRAIERAEKKLKSPTYLRLTGLATSSP